MTRNKIIIPIIFFLLLTSIVAAIDFNPMGNVNLKNRYSVINGVWVNATYGTFTNMTIGTLFGSLPWDNVTGKPTHLSNFTDDLGNRGYTHLSNFTDDLNTSAYSTNYSTYSNYSSFSNSSDYWDGLGSPSDITSLGSLSSLDVNGAADVSGQLTLHSNLDMSTTNITAADYITANYFSGDGSLLTALSIVWTSVTGRPTHLSNFTNDLSSMNNNIDMNGNNISNVNYLTANYFSGDGSLLTGLSIAWSAITGKATHLSNFTDDLGDRGYTALSNFTDDLGDRGYTALSNFTDDLGDRGYTHLSNFTNDISSMNNNIDMNGNNISNVDYVTANYFVGDGSLLTGLTNISTASVNHSNTSDYWDDLNTPTDITALAAIQHSGNVDMNGNNITNVDWLFVHNVSGYSPITINSNLEMQNNNISGLNKIVASYFSGDGSLLTAVSAAWSSISGKPTHLSNFTDNLGNRGYSHLSNFTNDIGAGGSVTYNNLDFDTITEDMIREQVENIQIVANLSLTPMTYSNYVRDAVSDSNGYLNLINATGTNTTAFYSSTKYMTLSNNVTESNVALGGGAGYYGVGSFFIPKQKLMLTSISYSCAVVPSSVSLYLKNLTLVSDSGTATSTKFNFTNPVAVEKDTEYVVNIVVDSQNCAYSDTHTKTGTYLNYSDGAVNTASHTYTFVAGIDFSTPAITSVEINLPTKDGTPNATSLFLATPDWTEGTSNITYVLKDSDGTLSPEYNSETLNTITTIDETKLLDGNGKMIVYLSKTKQAINTSISALTLMLQYE